MMKRKDCFYDCEVHENNEVYTIPNMRFPEDFIEFKMLHKDDEEVLKKALDELESRDEIRCVIRVRAFTTDEVEWYKLVINAYSDEFTSERECIRYLKNVNKDVQDKEQLEDKAYRDGMTGLFNASTGRELIDNICKCELAYTFYVVLSKICDNLEIKA